MRRSYIDCTLGWLSENILWDVQLAQGLLKNTLYPTNITHRVCCVLMILIKKLFNVHCCSEKLHYRQICWKTPFIDSKLPHLATLLFWPEINFARSSMAWQRNKKDSIKLHHNLTNFLFTSWFQRSKRDIWQSRLGQ